MTLPEVIVVHPEDDVATALVDLEVDTQVAVGGSSKTPSIRTIDPILRGHKIALIDLEPGMRVRKYGEVIGQVAAPVRAGCHVHTHNLISLRIAGQEREE